jgi:hypothetical protein
MKYLPAVVIFFLFNQSVIIAIADTIPHIFTGFQSHYGFIIPHSESIRDVSHTKPYGIEISRCNLHTSFNDWKVFNAYWISGVEAGYFNFQNPKVLGYVFIISAFSEPIISYGEKYIFSVRGGGGLSYHNKFYDPVDNPLNMFFSTRISFPLYVAVRFKYRIADRTFLILSGNYNHISNGGYKQPNKGMNFPTLALGLEHFQKTPQVLDDNYSSYPEIRKPGIFLTIQALTTVRVINEEGDFPQKTCFVYGFHTRISKSLGSIYALNAGAELISDGYIKETLKRYQIDVDNKRFAVTFGQDFILGKVIFTQYFGFYLYSPDKARNPIYQKYEIAYNICKNILFGVYIKAHAQVAESMGITFNYRLSGTRSKN